MVENNTVNTVDTVANQGTVSAATGVTGGPNPADGQMVKGNIGSNLGAADSAPGSPNGRNFATVSTGGTLQKVNPTVVDTAAAGSTAITTNTDAAAAAANAVSNNANNTYA